MIPVKGYTTFHPLKHCIVGRGHSPESVPDILKETMHNTEEDIQNLIKVLESMGVNCVRPEAITDHNQRPPISPRDYFTVLGEQLFVGKIIGGYTNILKNIDRKNTKWFMQDDISSGNIIRCGTQIHWDISSNVSKSTEEKMLQWFDENKYKVKITRYGWHMDGVYSILKPGVIVATRDLPDLEKIYPNWDIHYLTVEHSKPYNYDAIDWMKKTGYKWSGNFNESNYNVNILSIDEQNCVMTKENKELFYFLEKHKINPIVCQFRDKYFWDNGLHCITQDLFREGILENYM